MHRLGCLQLLALSLCALGQALTLYNGDHNTLLSTPTTAAPGAPTAVYTGLAAYDPTILIPPPAPFPPTTQVGINIPGDPSAAGYALSRPQKGNFLGFSIELSVATNVMGSSPAALKPIFLNYMANIRNRAGAGPLVRVGGNTQESSSMFLSGTSNGEAVEKIKVGEKVTSTPIINFTPDLFYIMSNISAVLDTDWYFGLSFNSSAVGTISPNVPLVASYAQQILGSHLKGLAMGNEPDLYVSHWTRPQGWTMADYNTEWSSMRQNIVEHGNLQTTVPLMGPSTCCSRVGFELGDVLNSGWLDGNSEYINTVTVQRYPANNCQINNNVVNSQEIFPTYLNHTGPQSLTSSYLADSQRVLAAGKELVMLEFNTASCGGFPGVSDSFGAALWLVDWSLQLAWANFSAALMHVGGQNVYYNPFTPPPVNAPGLQWSTGSVYYSSLVIAEAFGSSNKSQVFDYWGNTPVGLPGHDLHPAYLVYEDGVPTRAVLFNYVDDATGASDLTVSLGGLATGAVHVRYLLAPSVSEHDDITWANQTLGYAFQSDGRLHGTAHTETIPCVAGTCNVKVPAPGLAVVFFTDTALDRSSPQGDAPISFATTVIGQGRATIHIDDLHAGNGGNPPRILNAAKPPRNFNAARARAGPGSSLVWALLPVALGLARWA